MKKSGIFYLAALSVIALIVSSCGGISKMAQPNAEVRYTATPNPVEMHADSVEVTFKGSFPAKYFHKKAVLTITPALYDKSGNKIAEFKKYQIQGELAEANFPVISSVSGGSFAYTDKIAYKEEMRVSELKLDLAAALVGGEAIPIPSVKVADGVLATAGLVQKDPKTIIATDKFVRITPENKEADIHFVINKYNIRRSELKSDDVSALEDYIKAVAEQERKEFKGVKVHAYASPDGAQDLNERLSGNRMDVAKDYLNKKFNKANAGDVNFETEATSEDWDGFKKLMEQSDIQDKELILRVLSMYSDYDVREKEIKNFSKVFPIIAEDVLPELRRSQMFINVEKVGYSDEELIALADSIPDTLNVEELLKAATLLEDLGKKETLYTKATQNFSEDWRGHNNLGCVQFKQNNLSGAETAFENARKLDENNTIVLNNLGAVSFLNGDMDKAKEYFDAAAGAGKAVSYNQGVIMIIEGKYGPAGELFGDFCSFNVALSKYLNGNPDGALGKINCSPDKENAMLYYLKAIIGAKQQNSEMLYNSLRTAVDKDASLKELAKTDLEFAKYWEDGTFMSIVQ